MAKQTRPQISTRKDNLTTITDQDGQTILAIGSQEYTIKYPNGILHHRSINDSIPLVCGTVWEPSMLKAKFPIYLGICAECRKPSLFGRSRHGIVALSRAKICVDGGELCCPRHRRIGRDKKWRCLKHHKIYLAKRLGRAIFCERKEG